MSSIISAIGIATPRYCFRQKDVLQFMIHAHQLNSSSASRLKMLYEVSGIEYRYSAVPDFVALPGNYTFFGNNAGLEPFPDTCLRSKIYEEQAWQVGKAAAEQIFTDLPRLMAAQITHLITVSCTGMYAPGLDIDLIEKLGLNNSTERICINFMGCYGAFNALKTADYICRADPKAKVLIVDVELCTLHFQKENNLDNWVANSLFSDGAAAVLVESLAHRSGNQGFRLHSFYNLLVSEGRDEMSWRIGNNGFRMHLSSHVAKSIRGRIQEVVAQLMRKAELSFSDIGQYAIHPGGRRILEVCEEMLELPEESLECSYEVLRKYGNMSSATVLFVLKQLFESAQKDEKVLGMAFGPGLTFESMILEGV